MHDRKTLVMIALPLLLAAASPARAQSVAPADSPPAAVSPDELRVAAMALFEDPAATRRAAHLLRRESARRTSYDPEAYTALALGARLYAYAGDLLDAERMMVEAGEAALARGEIAKAAHAFVDAAVAARISGRQERASSLAARARLLTHSPFLPSSERSAILHRIG